LSLGIRSGPPLVYRQSPEKFVYQPSFVECPGCALLSRQFIYAFGVDTHKVDYAVDPELASAASNAIVSSFSSSASRSLDSYTDTTPIGWADSAVSVCRAHQKKPSLVLDRPYYEDVQYCLRLISTDGKNVVFGDFEQYLLRDRPTTAFRIEGEVVVAVTVNPSSPFRQPTSIEANPYGEVLVKIMDLTKLAMATELVGLGWKLGSEYRPITFLVEGRDNIRPQNP
jgi:hypothetical protein